jgi:hypothetical protein
MQEQLPEARGDHLMEELLMIQGELRPTFNCSNFKKWSPLFLSLLLV